MTIGADKRMNRALNGLGDATSDYLDALAQAGNVNLFGTQDAYGATTAVSPTQTAPASTFDLSKVGEIINAAGQIYQYVQKLDAAGNPVAVPVPQAQAQSQSMFGNIPPAALLLGVGALALLLIGKGKRS